MRICNINKYIGLALICTISLILIVGCKAGQNGVSIRESMPSSQMISRENLRTQMNAFEDAFVDTMKNASLAVERDYSDPRYKQLNLHMNIRLTQAIRTLMEKPDPLVCLIESWELSVRLIYYFQQGDGAALYGPAKDLISKAAEKNEAEIRRIASFYLPPETFENARQQVHNFAKANPVQGTFGNLLVYATESSPDKPSPFRQVLNIPLAPFRAMEGMDNTAAAIHRFTDSANRFNEILNATPEAMRWEMLLFLYDLQNSEMSRSVLKNMEDFTGSARRLVEQTESLPRHIRQELAVFVEQMEQKQEAIRQTLKDLQSASDSLHATAASFDQTAQSWQSAAGETTQLVHAWRQFLESRPKTDAPPVRPEDIQKAAVEIQNTSRELRLLVSELNNLTQSESVSQVQKNIKETILAGQTAAQAVVDRFAWRLVQIMVGVIILTGVVVWIKKHTRRHSGQS